MIVIQDPGYGAAVLTASHTLLPCVSHGNVVPQARRCVILNRVDDRHVRYIQSWRLEISDLSATSKDLQWVNSIRHATCHIVEPVDGDLLSVVLVNTDPVLLEKCNDRNTFQTRKRPRVFASFA